MKTITAIRRRFWADHPQFKGSFRKTYRHNRYNATIRTSFNMWLDGIHKDGKISDSLANRATL